MATKLRFNSKIKVQQDDDSYQVGDPLIKIMDGATLTIVDSKGGGKMIANSWIKMFFNLFYVYNGGELILNAPGATFESGYSEKVWLVGAYKEGKLPSSSNTGYDGYARNQASGTAVWVENGGKLTVSGGTVKGRGYSVADVSGYSYSCAAIEAVEGADVRIIDGNIYGMGGANALSISKDANLTIESGVFDVYKVDKLVLPKADREYQEMSWGDSVAAAFLGVFGGTYASLRDNEVDNYEDGRYGNIGIPDRVLNALAAKGTMVEVIQGDHDVSGDELCDEDTGLYNQWGEKRLTIRPKSGSATRTNRMNLEPTNGMYSWNPNASNSFMVNVSIDERYFSDHARELSTNYYRERKGKGYGESDKDKEYYLEYKFYLYDRQYDGEVEYYLGKKLVRPEATSLTDVNIAELWDLSKSSEPMFDIEEWKSLREGKYMVRCELTEIWKGEHSYKSAWYTEIPLRIRWDGNKLRSKLDEAGFKPDFDISHTWCRGNEEDPPVMSLILSDETQVALKEAVKSIGKDEYANYNDITVTYTLWDYDPNGNVFEKISETVKPNEYTTLSSATAGLKVISVDIGIPYYGTLPVLKGYDYISVSKNFLLLPPMERSDGEKVGYHKAVELSNGQSAAISLAGAENCNLAGLAKKGEFSWQWYFVPGGHDMHPSESDLYDSEYTKLSTESDITMALDGSYRLKCEYLPGKDGGRTQTFVSAPVDIAGADTNRVLAKLEASKEAFDFSQEDLLEAELTLTCTGMTDEIESVQFSMKGYPEGMYSRPVERNKNDSNIYTISLCDFTSLEEAWYDDGTTDPSGEYTFRVTVKCKENGISRYRVYSNDVTVTMKKGAQGYSLYANNEYLGEGHASQSAAASQVIPLYLDSSTTDVMFTTEYYPKNATHDDRFVNEDEKDINYRWTVVWGDATISLSGDTNKSYAAASIHKPGMAIIGFQKWAGSDNYANAPEGKKTTTYFEVCVPVTEVEFQQPNYQLYIGDYYRGIKPTVTAYATCGAYCNESAFDFRYDAENERTEYAPSFWNSDIHMGLNSYRKAIEANDLGRVIYPLHLANYQSYPLMKDSEDSAGNANYVVNTSAVKLTIVQPDGSKVTKTAKDWGVSDGNSMVSMGSVSPETNQAYFNLTQDVFVKDENATYIDVVTITTTEPGVGDPINEKITVYNDVGNKRDPQPMYSQYKAADVFSMSNVKTADGKSIIMPYSSEVSKATAETVGAPYTDAVSAKAESEKSSGELVGKSYENGTYFHAIQLVTNSKAAADGTKYYFAPDCKVILNGHLLDFGDLTTYPSNYSSLSFKYFYDVGNVNMVSAVELSGITPLQGNVPAELADVTATGYDPSSSLPATVDVGVNKLIWFVDDNNNGDYDEGEEVNVKWNTTTNDKGEKEITGYDAENSTLWWDGTFLPGVKYSALVAIGTDDSATRFAENVELRYDTKNQLLSGGQKQFVLTFPADETIRTIHVPMPVGAAAANPNRDLLGLFNAGNQGYTTVVNEVYKHNDSNDTMSSSANVSNFYTGSNLVRETLDVGKYWMVLRFDTKSGYTMANDVKVLVNGVDTGEFGYGAEQKKDLFVKSDSNWAAAWRTFEVTEGEDTPSGDILLGDVNGDGSITADDLVTLAQHVAKINTITDEQALLSSDVTKDETIDANDMVKLARYVAKIISSFD